MPVSRRHTYGVPRDADAKCDTPQQVGKPLRLFVACRGVEELRRFLPTPQFGNAVERDHGTLHLLERCAGEQNGAFREHQLAASHLDSLRFGSFAKCCGRRLPIPADG